jgi:hypothetical protein
MHGNEGWISFRKFRNTGIEDVFRTEPVDNRTESSDKQRTGKHGANDFHKRASSNAALKKYLNFSTPATAGKPSPAPRA